MLRHNIIKGTISALLMGALQGLNYLQFRGKMNLADIIWSHAFSDFEIIISYMASVVFNIMHFIFFFFLFGTYIYQHYCSASIYYFSRCKNRRRWF